MPAGADGVTAGAGDAVRPDAFQGSLTASGAGLSGTVKVVATGGAVYAKLPLLPGYHKINPADYGFGDPGQLIDPTHGLSSLLVTPTSASYDGQTRVDGAVLDRVKAVLPGAPVAHLLGSADASKPVDAELGIDPTTHQVRSRRAHRAVLQRQAGQHLHPDAQQVRGERHRQCPRLAVAGSAGR